MNWKKLSNVVSKVKENNLEDKIPHVTISIHINLYNTDKQSLKKIANVDKKILHLSSLVTTTFTNANICDAKNKITDVSGLINIQVKCEIK